MAETDSMPRLQHLTPHLSALLKTLGPSGATFEVCRQRYAVVARDLAAAGVGRITVSRIGIADSYWSPTQELLDEAMRLRLVDKAPTPSARKYLDDYRSRVYSLTPAGLDAAAKLEDPAAFTDLVTEAVLDAHATMRSMLRMLAHAPLVMPEVSESQLEEAKQAGNPTHWLAEWAAEIINAGPTGSVVTAEEVKTEIGQWRTKRFGTTTAEVPSRKAMVDMVDDAFASIALKARGLPIGPIAFRVAGGWGSALRLIDQSRYVPWFEGANVIWVACDLVELPIERGTANVTVEVDPAGQRLQVARRRMKAHGRRTAEALIAAYQRQAAEDMTATPYLPLHVVRAEATYNAGVTRGLGDMAIEALAGRQWPDLKVEVFLHAGAGMVPSSEPVYQRGGRRTALSIQPSGNASDTPSSTTNVRSD